MSSNTFTLPSPPSSSLSSSTTIPEIFVTITRTASTPATATDTHYTTLTSPSVVPTYTSYPIPTQPQRSSTSRDLAIAFITLGCVLILALLLLLVYLFWKRKFRRDGEEVVQPVVYVGRSRSEGRERRGSETSESDVSSLGLGNGRAVVGEQQQQQQRRQQREEPIWVRAIGGYFAPKRNEARGEAVEMRSEAPVNSGRSITMARWA